MIKNEQTATCVN